MTQLVKPAIVLKHPSLSIGLLPDNKPKIRLADFIYNNTQQIISEWETFARSMAPAVNNVTPLALRDHIEELLAFIVRDIKSPQTRDEQIEKSKGEKQKAPHPTAAETHAASCASLIFSAFCIVIVPKNYLHLIARAVIIYFDLHQR